MEERVQGRRRRVQGRIAVKVSDTKTREDQEGVGNDVDMLVLS